MKYFYIMKEPITKKGFLELEKKIYFLKYIEKPKILKEIKRTREFGDLRENAEYHAVKEEMYILQKKIRKLEEYIANSEIIDIEKFDNYDIIMFGAYVYFLKLNNPNIILNYQIVGEYESDIDNNKISVKSPLASSMILKKRNEIFNVEVNGIVTYYKIIDIKYV